MHVVFMLPKTVLKLVNKLNIAWAKFQIKKLLFFITKYFNEKYFTCVLNTN